jgi:hypothetical protein
VLKNKEELGMYVLHEARMSFRYWHASEGARDNMIRPFFDMNQCMFILEVYKGPQKIAIK